jgi:hypothetical protein
MFPQHEEVLIRNKLDSQNSVSALEDRFEEEALFLEGCLAEEALLDG